MSASANRVLTLHLTEDERRTIAECLLRREEMAESKPHKLPLYRPMSVFETLRDVFSSPCAYIQTAESNYVKLVDALLYVEFYGGDCEEYRALRRRIYKLLAG